MIGVAPPRLDVRALGLKDVVRCTAALRRLDAGAASMEEVARRVARFFHEALVDGAARACALARVYKTHPLEGLDAARRAFALRALGAAPPPGARCLTLLGTAGDEPAWNEVGSSQGHLAVPLLDERGIAGAPMIARLLEQLGVRVGALLRPDPALLVDEEQRTFNVFHVADARGSPFIPAQGFVERHGVRSVIGFGGLLPAGDLFVTIVFSRAAISRDTAELFRTVPLAMKLSLLPFAGPRCFDEGAGAAPEVDLAARLAAIEQLLEVQERVALTEATRAEAALAEARARAASLTRSEAAKGAILDAALMPLLVLREDRRILEFNPAAERLFGRDRADALGRDAGELLAADDRAAFQEALAGVARALDEQGAEAGRRLELSAERADGDRAPVELAIASRATCPPEFVVCVRDLSEAREVERLKHEFVSTVSHELRTPLTSIQGSLGLIAGGAIAPLPPDVAAMIDIAHRNSERLVRLINDILDVEKIESGKLDVRAEPVDVALVVRQAVEATRSFAAPLGVSYALAPAPERLHALADADRVAQVVTNLVSNAAKFSAAGGVVTVACRREERAIRVSVTDRGPGIPEAFRARVFTRFAQADGSDGRRRGGTGLGLSICRLLVERMGGRIGFESRPHVETTFWFELPELREAPPPPAPPTPVEAGAPRILVVEDDPDVALLLRLLLERGGLATEGASSASAARAALAARRFDGMTLDVELPDRSGLELLRELRDEAATRDLPVVVVSARDAAGETRIGAGVCEWLCKPVDPERLLAAVRRATRCARARAPRVLHVEDDGDVARIVERLLEGMDVVHARTLAEGRAALSDPRVDLLILDVGLPDGDGRELLGATSVPTIIFSARDDVTELSSSVAAALVKSRCSNELLLETVRALIAGSRP